MEGGGKSEKERKDREEKNEESSSSNITTVQQLFIQTKEVVTKSRKSQKKRRRPVVAEDGKVIEHSADGTANDGDVVMLLSKKQVLEDESVRNVTVSCGAVETVEREYSELQKEEDNERELYLAHARPVCVYRGGTDEQQTGKGIVEQLVTGNLLSVELRQYPRVLHVYFLILTAQQTDSLLREFHGGECSKQTVTVKSLSNVLGDAAQLFNYLRVQGKQFIIGDSVSCEELTMLPVLSIDFNLMTADDINNNFYIFGMPQSMVVDLNLLYYICCGLCPMTSRRFIVTKPGKESVKCPSFSTWQVAEAAHRTLLMMHIVLSHGASHMEDYDKYFNSGKYDELDEYERRAVWFWTENLLALHGLEWLIYMIGSANKYIRGEVSKRMPPHVSKERLQKQQDESVVKTIQVLFSRDCGELAERDETGRMSTAIATCFNVLMNLDLVADENVAALVESVDLYLETDEYSNSISDHVDDKRGKDRRGSESRRSRSRRRSSSKSRSRSRSKRKSKKKSKRKDNDGKSKSRSRSKRSRSKGREKEEQSEYSRGDSPPPNRKKNK